MVFVAASAMRRSLRSLCSLGWAAGKVLARHGSRKIIIGKDTRISGYMLESALEAGLAAAGLCVVHRAYADTGHRLPDARLPRRGGDCYLCFT